MDIQQAINKANVATIAMAYPSLTEFLEVWIDEYQGILYLLGHSDMNSDCFAIC